MIAPKPRQAILSQPVKLSKLLLVEGETPSHFFEAFLKHLKIDQQVEVRN